jgi:hypothetical protein
MVTATFWFALLPAGKVTGVVKPLMRPVAPVAAMVTVVAFTVLGLMMVSAKLMEPPFSATELAVDAKATEVALNVPVSSTFRNRFSEGLDARVKRNWTMAPPAVMVVGPEVK